MANIEMVCPGCNAPGSVPRDKMNTRLVCKKCHAVFHLSPSGRAVLGEPPMSEADKEAAKAAAAAARRDADWEMPSLSVSPRARATLAALVALLAIAGIVRYGQVSWSSTNGENLLTRANNAAKAIAAGKTADLQAISVPETREATARFLEGLGPAFESVRAQSPTREMVANILLLSVTPDDSGAQVRGVFTPNLGSTRDRMISGIEPAKDAATASADAMLWFAKDAKGNWLLDGQKCVEYRPKGR